MTDDNPPSLDIDEELEKAIELRRKAERDMERFRTRERSSKTARWQFEAGKKATKSASEERDCPLCGETVTGHTLSRHLTDCPGS